MTRRHFLPLAAAGFAYARGVMKITAIEAHEILLPYQDYNAKTLFRYNGFGNQVRTIYVVKTDIGLEGLGETPGPSRGERFERYTGTDPFEWVGSSDSLVMNMAMYDLMG